MAIAERMPDVGRRFYEKVLEKNISQFAAYLAARITPAMASSLTTAALARIATHKICVRQRCSCRSYSRLCRALPGAHAWTSVESATRMFLAHLPRDIAATRPPWRSCHVQLTLQIVSRHTQSAIWLSRMPAKRIASPELEAFCQRSALTAVQGAGI